MKLADVAYLAAKLALLIVLSHAAVARAAEVKVLSTIGMRSALNELGPRFERETGHRLAIRYDVASLLKRRVEGGEAYDVAILTSAATDDLAQQGRIIASTRAVIARAGNGLAVRAGTPRPDIGSVEALKRTLLGAKSIAYSRDGASGVYFGRLLERLEIADSLRGRTQRVRGDVAELVARGDAEMAVQLIPELIAVPGVALVGPFPPEVQNYVVFSAGVSAASRDQVAARALISYLAAPASAPVYRAKGMEPG